MKTYIIPSYDLGQHSLEHAFGIVFSDHTMLETHGSSLKCTPWQDNKRTADFYVQLDMIPKALRHMLGGNGLHVTVQQTLNKSDESWKVSNLIHMHILWAKLFRIESCFELHKDVQHHIFLTGEVKCFARLLPPLNMIAENFMLNQCKKEIATYTEVVAKKFISDSVSNPCQKE